jgi:hypothetical protein
VGLIDILRNVVDYGVLLYTSSVVDRFNCRVEGAESFQVSITQMHSVAVFCTVHFATLHAERGPPSKW